MKEVDIWGGTIDSCLNKLREMAASENDGEVLKLKFNDSYILSTDTDDDAYLRIVGMKKKEFTEKLIKHRLEYEEREKEHKARIPELSDDYRKKARGLVLDSELDLWDKIVPIRLGDLYHGMELQQVLDCCKIMQDDSMVYAERLEKAYDVFMSAGHSGTSAGLTMSMLRRFCPNGNDLADACRDFKFERAKK